MHASNVNVRCGVYKLWNNVLSTEYSLCSASAAVVFTIVSPPAPLTNQMNRAAVGGTRTALNQNK